jgi:hypothetical protein
MSLASHENSRHCSAQPRFLADIALLTENKGRHFVTFDKFLKKLLESSK